jgi:hypothetical protein
MNTKLDTGRVFERVFQIYGEQFTLLIPAALLLFIPVAILNGIVLTGGGVLAALITAAISVIATYWYQGMVVEAVVDILDGRRDHTVGSLFSSASPFIWPLFAAGVLAGIGIAIGLILLIVPGLFLLTIWAVIVPVIVVEKSGVLDSFGRSRGLVRENGWRVFGVIVVLFLLQAVVGGILQAVAGSITDSFAGYAVADLIVRTLIVPLSAIAATVMFVELRRIKGEPLAEDTTAEPAPLSAAPESPAAPPAPEAPAGQ